MIKCSLGLQPSVWIMQVSIFSSVHINRFHCTQVHETTKHTVYELVFGQPSRSLLVPVATFKGKINENTGSIAEKLKEQDGVKHWDYNRKEDDTILMENKMIMMEMTVENKMITMEMNKMIIVENKMIYMLHFCDHNGEEQDNHNGKNRIITLKKDRRIRMKNWLITMKKNRTIVMEKNKSKRRTGQSQ